ncbi:hypothetical protein KC19_VG076300 [Ceratodon purpureus]|uniref:Uncharacterized protein n=1 Tax=Ceratodon purpureus TaxID=3225 RepID=A0A8T0HN18_CERPU|nr:hypothetical protein KC19_VG076300 [Ceratodon purpureus]
MSLLPRALSSHYLSAATNSLPRPVFPTLQAFVSSLIPHCRCPYRISLSQLRFFSLYTLWPSQLTLSQSFLSEPPPPFRFVHTHSLQNSLTLSPLRLTALSALPILYLFPTPDFSRCLSTPHSISLNHHCALKTPAL